MSTTTTVTWHCFTDPERPSDFEYVLILFVDGIAFEDYETRPALITPGVYLGDDELARADNIPGYDGPGFYVFRVGEPIKKVGTEKYSLPVAWAGIPQL